MVSADNKHRQDLEVNEDVWSYCKLHSNVTESIVNNQKVINTLLCIWHFVRFIHATAANFFPRNSMDDLNEIFTPSTR